MQHLAVMAISIALAFGLLATPLAAAAQETSRIPRIGIMLATTPPPVWRKTEWGQAFINTLHAAGYEEGRSITLEILSAEGDWKRLPTIAAELVDLKVDLVVVSACGGLLDAARRATSTIPIVVVTCNDDMVKTGVVASLAKPGGNITGLSKLTPELASKRLELLKELVPRISRVVVLWDSKYSDFSAD